MYRLLVGLLMCFLSYVPVEGASVKVSWDVVPEGVDGYRVYRSDDIGQSYEVIWTGSDTTCIDTLPQLDAAYHYMVRSYLNDGRESLNSNVVAGYVSTGYTSPWSGYAEIMDVYYDQSLIKVEWRIDSSDESVLQYKAVVDDTFVSANGVPIEDPGQYVATLPYCQPGSSLIMRMTAWIGDSMTIYADSSMLIPQPPPAPKAAIRPFR